ncbi:hypothetical protein [Streptomyces capitiformicae]|uniref:Uncharacterized protein n=1 Tax=Streptomyces capitiformicae TaxID=2014920 RepID=A0A918Z2S4_9ACTN|nr:hypothetical protein [Streptomyces capitiformicae]GHE34264.1 hypothetical protein GCM10017771_51750 [Streptomyces capitiformicae]
MLREQGEQYAVVLARPGRPDIRLGPYDFLDQAASMTTSLRLQRRSTQHVPGTTVPAHPYVPGLDYLDPRLPRDPDQLATLLDGDLGGDGTGRNFPDLWARLQAQEGYEEAARIWKRACIEYDAPLDSDKAGRLARLKPSPTTAHTNVRPRTADTVAGCGAFRVCPFSTNLVGTDLLTRTDKLR